MTETTWTIAEAKSRLSEILRRANTEGPQRIGTQKRYVIVPEALWEEVTSQKQPLGEWLLANMTPSDKVRDELGTDNADYELELPDRRQIERATHLNGQDHQ